MIGHDAEGDDMNTAEGFVFVEIGNELILLAVEEGEPAVYDARGAMIERRGMGLRRFQPWQTHGREKAESQGGRQEEKEEKAEKVKGADGATNSGPVPLSEGGSNPITQWTCPSVVEGRPAHRQGANE